jgi:predicted TIM-barrel fold metal-dependent hydrolase
MRIDGHVHGDPEALRIDPKGYVQTCRDQGIEAVVHIAPAERCLRAIERFGDFVIGVALIRMDQDGISDIAHHIGAGCKGIKFIRPDAPYADRRYWPLYAKLEALQATAVFHTGYLGFRQREENPAHMEYMRAGQIDVIARRFPDLKILMAHFSNPWWEEAWKVAWANRNVYADLSGGTALRRSLTLWAETFAPNGQLHEPSFSKLCFGSDVTYFEEPPAFRFREYITFYDEIFRRVAAPPHLVEKVNRGNARLLFGLESGPA